MISENVQSLVGDIRVWAEAEQVTEERAAEAEAIRPYLSTSLVTEQEQIIALEMFRIPLKFMAQKAADELARRGTDPALKSYEERIIKEALARLT